MTLAVCSSMDFVVIQLSNGKREPERQGLKMDLHRP